MMKKILVTGAVGQIGSELTVALRNEYGEDRVVATDIRMPTDIVLRDSGPFEFLRAEASFVDAHTIRLNQGRTLRVAKLQPPHQRMGQPGAARPGPPSRPIESRLGVECHEHELGILDRFVLVGGDAEIGVDEVARVRGVYRRHPADPSG